MLRGSLKRTKLYSANIEKVHPEFPSAFLQLSKVPFRRILEEKTKFVCGTCPSHSGVTQARTCLFLTWNWESKGEGKGKG